MTHSLGDGIAGILNRVQILFQDLHVSEVAKFVASLYGEGYQYNSVNAYMSPRTKLMG